MSWRPHGGPWRGIQPKEIPPRPARALRQCGDARQESDAAMGGFLQAGSAPGLVGLCRGGRAVKWIMRWVRLQALCAALTGRTHGCTDQPANVKKSLANSEPSTHGTKRTSRDVCYLSAFGGKADICDALDKFATDALHGSHTDA